MPNTESIQPLMIISDEKRWELILKKVLANADLVQRNAGMSGACDDGGARKMRNEVEFFNMGKDSRLHPEWVKYAREVEEELDPEWDKYVELRKKFEGK